MNQEYPTDEELKRIEEWDIWYDLQGFVQYVTQLWKYDDYITLKDGYVGKRYAGESPAREEWERRANQHKLWHVSTAGWSGNESIIGAMQKNYQFWWLCWHSTTRGGHYIFHLRRDVWDGTYAKEHPKKL